MREIRPSGLEGGVALTAPSLPLSTEPEGEQAVRAAHCLAPLKKRQVRVPSFVTTYWNNPFASVMMVVSCHHVGRLVETSNW